MPVKITVTALSLKDVQLGTAGELKWSCNSRVPSKSGVYLWIARKSGALIYVGCARGNGGLKQRLNHENLQVAASILWDYRRFATEPAPGRMTYFPSAHSRVVRQMDACVYWARTDDPLTWERKLLTLSIRLSSTFPLLNGGAWQSHRRANPSIARWAAAAAQRLLGDVGTASQGDLPDVSLDPATQLPE